MPKHLLPVPPLQHLDLFQKQSTYCLTDFLQWTSLMAAFPYHWPIYTTQAYPLGWPVRGRARPQPMAPVFTSAPMQTVGPPLTSAIYTGAVRTLEGYTTALLLCARIAQIKNITGPVAGRATCLLNTPPPPGLVPQNKLKLP